MKVTSVVDGAELTITRVNEWKELTLQYYNSYNYQVLVQCIVYFQDFQYSQSLILVSLCDET